MFLLRVTLPDRPGSLGAVATAMGGVGGDINAVEIVQKGNGIVVDDFIVDLPPGRMAETIVTACNALEGVHVEWISRYPEGGGLQSDLEALERMTADPTHAGEILASLCPVVFRSHWATLLDVNGAEGVQLFGTAQAPDLDADLIKRFAPFDAAHRIDLETGWILGWGESTVVVTPLKGGRAVAIGRLGGPPFLDSEINRLHHLAALAT